MDEIMNGLSMDIEQTEREKLQAVFPQCFVEGKLDIDKLLNMCGEYITDDYEKYSFTWKGKSQCLQLAQKRSTGTLRPYKGESVDWDATKNLYIEGDNLEVLKLLQTSYYNKVKMIYIDPPYNTGHDFVYNDNFADPMARYKEITAQTTKSNPESAGRFHTNWLNMMYPRLRLAANLLRDDGVIFISIDDGEVHNLRKVCDEVFGEENFVTQIVWEKKYTRANDARWFSDNHDHLLCFAKSKEQFKINLLPRNNEQLKAYLNPDNHPKGLWKATPLHAKSGTNTEPYTFVNGITWKPPAGTYRRFNNESMQNMDLNNEIWFGSDGNQTPSRKSFLCDVKEGVTPVTIWPYEEVGHNHEANNELKSLQMNGCFNNPKPIRLIQRCLQLVTKDNDIILDFFSGSATTAHAVMQLNADDGGNRRFICVQLPELLDEKSEAYKAGYRTICDIGKTRILKAGIKIKQEQSDQIKMGDDEKQPLDMGFRVFKLDTSNLKTWDDSPIPDDDLFTLEQRIRGMIESIKSDRTDEDMVYEVMLKLGQDLCEAVTPIDCAGRTVYGIGADIRIIVCLTQNVTVETAEAMAEYAPGRIIFSDQCFANINDQSNVKLTLRNKKINIKML